MRETQVEKLARRPLTLPQLAEVAGVEYRTLHTWLKRGLLQPSIQTSHGTGTPNLFSDQDALAVRILADLRRAGLDLDRLDQAAAALREQDELSTDAVLVINGGVSVFVDEKKIVSALRHPEPALVYRVAWAERELELFARAV